MSSAHRFPASVGPDPETAPGMSDDALVAALRMSRTIEGTTPVAALIARHGPSVSDYAEICASGSPALARAFASAAFRQVVQELQRTGPTGALRPRLLVTVREAARARSRTGSASGLSYDQAGAADSDRPPSRSVAENRHLSHVSFLQLPRTTQYVLWHMDVEAEPWAVPAALLGIEGDITPFELDRAREQLRSALLRTHVENSAGRQCRDYSRLLDAPSRGAGSTLPEVQAHLDQCAYCRHAAEQLRLCAEEPGVLLAEALLGESAHPYLAACRVRPSRTASAPTAAAGAAAGADVGPAGTRHRSRGSARERKPRATRRATKIFVVGIVAGSAAVAAALFVTGTSSQNTTPTTQTQQPTPTPTPSTSSPADSTALPVPPESGRLRNAAADLCMDVRGTPPERGAEVTLSTCSSDSTQRWTYLEDGLLRNLAAPDLCLDAGGDDEVLDLESCDSSGDVSFGLRFELSPEGELFTQDEGNLVIVPASPEAGTILVPSARNGEAKQRWLVEAISGASTTESDT
ncbi:RICIN domain-containing protein [Streptomyces caniscabiei]|uniref:RICIN domain-containing protein n=1 Tax=Streptomyces caniscabiei TaxID=2746961 RepID=UPI001872FFA8|nr:RICIN domain-containing protein [Streptomyces caniscabiei]MBE4774792.1 ricin-type beta-trefoil lectin domain protein [Streptomyces caniscabiei]MDX2956609.1 RICIN domain-containing protein [Streptomyces caniscabiei]